MCFNPVVLALLITTAFTRDECFQVGKNDGESNDSDLTDLGF